MADYRVFGNGFLAGTIATIVGRWIGEKIITGLSKPWKVTIFTLFILAHLLLLAIPQVTFQHLVPSLMFFTVLFRYGKIP